MSTTDLGAGFRSAPARDELVFRSDVDTIVETAMREVERRLEGLVKALVPKEADAPTVNVAAPSVTVNAPVDVPESSIDVTVTIPGMDQVQSTLDKILTELKKPSTRTVTRDNQGLIESVKETR